jgi:DnaK suppressor protein
VCKLLKNRSSLFIWRVYGFSYFYGMKDVPDKVQLKELIAKKIRQADDLIKELEDLTRPVAPDVAIGRVSRMDAINNKSVNEAALRQAREKLHGLQHALDNIDKPTFGVCIRCGGQIPLGRMMVMPESTRCMRCS